MKKYEFMWDGEMPSTIIEIIPFVDMSTCSDSLTNPVIPDRDTGHTVNIYGDRVSFDFRLKIQCSHKYRRVCPRDYFYPNEREVFPIIKVFPIKECPIYEELKSFYRTISKNSSYMYKVYDSLGNFMERFSTYKQASEYKSAYGNYGWTIKH